MVGGMAKRLKSWMSSTPPLYKINKKKIQPTSKMQKVVAEKATKIESVF